MQDTNTCFCPPLSLRAASALRPIKWDPDDFLGIEILCEPQLSTLSLGRSGQLDAGADLIGPGSICWAAQSSFSWHNRHTVLKFAKIVPVALAGAFLATVAGSAETRRPNFLIIVADDMGFADAGSYGGEIATPHLDALAEGGLRFTHFYNTGRCWPTRSSLLTGYYAQQIRRDGMPGVDAQRFGGRGVRPSWARLIPEYLRPVGYRAYHSGKWHVDGLPTDNGFDRSYRVRNAAGFFHLVGQELDGERLPDVEASSGNYLTTLSADHAIQCLQDHAEHFEDRPFFQLLAFHAPHFPLHAQPEDVARYRGRYSRGWDWLRRTRHARQLELGVTDAALSPLEADVGPPYAFPDAFGILGPGEIGRPVPWARLSAAQRRFQAEKMAIHAAMIDRMDREIGRVLDQLRKMNAFDDTVVFFLSDNGASAEIMVRGDGHDPDAPMGSAGTYLCLGPGFSSAANTPFRLHKTWVHEGGIATPLIVHWPSGIATPNGLRSTVAHVIDIAPTILELAGVRDAPGSGGPPFAGKSLARVLLVDGAPIHEAVWFYHQGNRALRQGDWKILHTVRTRADGWSAVAAEEDARQGEWSLYNLASDRGEQNDLADEQPDRVRAMASVWEAWRDRFIQDAGGVE